MQRKILAKDGNTFLLCTGYWLPSYKLKISWATGLHLAVMYGHLESLSVLLNHKATINCRPNGKAAIHIACETANVECLKILCNHGAKLNCFSMSGQAPLHFCTTLTSIPCAQQLIWRGKGKFWMVSVVFPRRQVSKSMYIYPSHPQLTCLFISDSFSPSLWPAEVSPLPVPGHQPLLQGRFPFQCLQPTAWSVPSSRAPLNQGISFSLLFFFLSSSSRFTTERLSHWSAPLDPFFLHEFPCSP